MLSKQGPHMYIIDLVDFKLDEKIADFWMVAEYEANAICAVANKDASIVVGLSIFDESKYYMHYYQRKKPLATEAKGPKVDYSEKVVKSMSIEQNFNLCRLS